MAGDWPDWKWDETLFAGAAEHYERGRLPYALGLADAFAKALGLDGRGRLLDVGCGPGTVALRFAHLFEEVVGVDADAGMIREAKRLAAERGVKNARWVERRAEELPAGLRNFRAVTFAASFHWLDRPRVAAAVRDMLDPGGAAIQVDGRHHSDLTRGDGHPMPPRARIEALRRTYLGDGRRAGRSIRNSSPDDEASVFRAAGFVGPEIVRVPDRRVIVRTIDEVVAETFSMSSTAPHLFGPRIDAFEADLRRLLADASPDGSFSVRLPDNQLSIWRPLHPGA
ncbi:MAG: class I SAM-dependent methyltransferase [Myxococcota bacterium]